MVDWGLIRELNDLHTCYWTDVEGCMFCTHSHMCIFDEDLLALDKEIAMLNRQLPYVGELEEIGGLLVNVEQEVLKRKIRKLERKRRGDYL